MHDSKVCKPAEGSPSILTVKIGLSELNIESLGLALMVTWLGVMLWNPIVVPKTWVSSEFDFSMHLLRTGFLAMFGLVYLLFLLFPRLLAQGKKRKFAVIALCTIIAALPILLMRTYEQAALSIPVNPFVLAGFLWCMSGAATAVLSISWDYESSIHLDFYQGTTNKFFSCIFSGALFTVLALVYTQAPYETVLLFPLLMLVCWIISHRNDGRTPQEGDNIISSTMVSTVRDTLGNGTNVFTFSYGLIMGIAGSVGTVCALFSFSYIFVGLSTAIAGFAGWLYLRRGINIDRRMFLAFPLFAVVCLFVLSFVGDIGRVALLALVFFMINFYNIINTAHQKETTGSQGLEGPYDCFSCEGRTFDMLGSAVGWLTSSLFLFLLPQYSTIFFFALTIVVVALSTSSFSNMSKAFSSSVPQSSFPNLAGDFWRRWNAACEEIARENKLSKRETEVFLLLARGRNRQYISSVLFISASTVRTHTYNIFQKMGIRDQQELLTIVEDETQKRIP